ncbi:hypothetical protein WCX18_02320 [Sulfurimonas sp. HSL1-2]|uniref:hypothetical protein n=1 Tax=Thiomicrolovo zhangzhouensis TaxID=3131933 RepID=UPI0031F9CF6F
MKIFHIFLALVNNHKFNTISFLFAVASILFAIYTTYFKNDDPIFSIRVEKEQNLIDIKEDIEELTILYKEKDIDKIQKTISSIIFKIKNEGNKPIIISYYDDNYPIKINVSNGKILKTEVLTSSNEYLQKNAIPKIINENTLTLSKVILEPDEFYDIKVRVLHDAKTKLFYKVNGKLAYVPTLEIKENEQKTDYIKEIFSGSPLIQISRFFFFFFILILMIMFTGYSYGFMDKNIFVNARKKLIENFKQKHEDIDKDFEIIIKEYHDNGTSLIQSYRIIKKIEEGTFVPTQILNLHNDSISQKTKDFLEKNEKTILDLLIDAKVINEEFVPSKNFEIYKKFTDFIYTDN